MSWEPQEIDSFSRSFNMVPTTATPKSFLFAVVILPYLAVSLFPFSPSSIVNVVSAAHPRRRVTIRREGAAYDREITTFTEDGRLAQVEYGLEASLRGSTVGAIQLKLLPTTEDSNDGNEAKNTTTKSSASCIVVCIENSSFGKMHRIDDHLWLLTAGLAGDARMLANQARRACQNHRLEYGEAPTSRQAARLTADFYHQLTRIGGCRPLGCTSILIGIDDSNNAKLFLTDPGGGVEECRSCAAGNSQDLMAKELMALVESFDSENGNKVVSSPQNQLTKNNGIARVAMVMAEKFLRLLDGTGKFRKGKNQKGPTLDVWTIKPMKHRRGGMLATCYSNVRKDNVNNILLQHI